MLAQGHKYEITQYHWYTFVMLIWSHADLAEVPLAMLIASYKK
jgi:hypothetical protein